MPESSLPELNQFREICSPIMSFANECLEFSDYSLTEAFTTKDQLFDIYKAWCINQGRQHGFKESFCRNFLAAYPDVSTTRKRVGNLRQYVFEGVTITPEAFKEYFGK
jgi:phage/plasmid-associated DNA primase